MADFFFKFQKIVTPVAIGTAIQRQVLPEGELAGTIVPMSKSLRNMFIAVFFMPLAGASAAKEDQDQTNLAAMKAVQGFIVEKTLQYGDAVNITVTPPGGSTRLPACARYEVFLPSDTPAWGNINVGVKCSQPNAWTAYLAVSVKISGQYLVSARKINRGQIITEGDVEMREGNLTELSVGVLTEPQLAIGRRAKITLPAKQALNRTHLIQAPIIKIGDKVRVVIRSRAVLVAAEGIALQNAAEGEPIKVRNSNGRTLTGTARMNGEVELIP